MCVGLILVRLFLACVARKLVRTSAGKSSPLISAKPLEVVVVYDPEPESEGDDDRYTKAIWHRVDVAFTLFME